MPKYCGLVACKLNICVYTPLILGAGISVDSAPACIASLVYNVKCIESDSHSSICIYDVSAGHYQLMNDETKTI